jgi:hypothetical protein
MSERQLGVPPRALRVGGANNEELMPLSAYRGLFLQAAV